MRWTILLILCAYAALGAEPITLHENGSVQGMFTGPAGSTQRFALDFGLPPSPAVRTWRDGAVSRKLWVTNGIHYLESVFITAMNAPGATNLVLWVSIEGRNTNSEYTEASASLSVALKGQRQPLELREDFLWSGSGEAQWRLGVFQIPDSGIKIAQGEVLQFAGNMPPSLDGTMTLKMPLAPVAGEEVWLQLLDLEFAAEVRRAEKASAEGEQRVRVLAPGVPVDYRP